MRVFVPNVRCLEPKSMITDRIYFNLLIEYYTFKEGHPYGVEMG